MELANRLLEKIEGGGEALIRVLKVTVGEEQIASLGRRSG